jgi:hypothetical protein
MHNQKEKFVVTTLIILFFLFIGIQVNATEVASSVKSVVEEPGKWDKAGKEVAEAAKAIGEASGESWDKTKDTTEKSYEDMKKKSAATWSKTKEKSGEMIDKSVDASGQAADSAAEKSKEAWDKTKEGSTELMDQAKSKVHEMTAPTPE